MEEYTAIFGRCDEGGYFLRCIEKEDIHIKGETIEELIIKFKYTIESLLHDENNIEYYPI